MLYREKVYSAHSSKNFKSIGTCISSVLVRVADAAQNTSCVWIGHVLKDSGRAKDGSEFEDAFLRQISK